MLSPLSISMLCFCLSVLCVVVCILRRVLLGYIYQLQLQSFMLFFYLCKSYMSIGSGLKMQRVQLRAAADVLIGFQIVSVQSHFQRPVSLNSSVLAYVTSVLFLSCNCHIRHQVNFEIKEFRHSFLPLSGPS